MVVLESYFFLQLDTEKSGIQLTIYSPKAKLIFIVYCWIINYSTILTELAVNNLKKNTKNKNKLKKKLNKIILNWVKWNV